MGDGFRHPTPEKPEMDRVAASQFAVQDGLEEAKARFLVPASQEHPIIVPPWIWGEARRDAYVKRANERRRAKADAAIRKIEDSMAALPAVGVTVTRSRAPIDLAALPEKPHLKLLRARETSDGEFKLAAERIGSDRERLAGSISIALDEWIETGDTVTEAADPGLFSVYELREVNLYDGQYRAHREETYFRHGITLSQASFRILENELRPFLEPRLSSFGFALFAVVSAIPSFLPGRQVADGSSVNALHSRELIPEFRIFLLEDPRDASSGIAECLSLAEASDAQNDSTEAGRA